jgi:hypothetical protein
MIQNITSTLLCGIILTPTKISKKTEDQERNYVI